MAEKYSTSCGFRPLQPFRYVPGPFAELVCCYRVPQTAIASLWHYSVTTAMFLLSMSLILAWGILCGTSLRGFVDGVILIGPMTSKFYTVRMCYFLQPWMVPAYIIVALLSLKTITQHRTRFTISLSLFRLGLRSFPRSNHLWKLLPFPTTCYAFLGDPAAPDR